MISQDTIQQIQSRIDIIDIVGGFVKLKKRGANYLGLCPFHNEKTPSFTVSPSKEIYKCFGCGRSGNSISFLMDHEKYSYVEALRWLATRYNVEIEETVTSAEALQQRHTADSLYILNQFAQQYFSKILFDSDEGLDVGLSYLKERGFREETIKKFQLGYSLQKWDEFAKTAIAAQYDLENLEKSGLIIVRDGKPLDNYRSRIIFPVHNQSGKILGFGARIIGKNDKSPKYINTPENEIYVKSKILYGSYFARHAIDKNDECLLVEGYTDVISLHQAGIENVVASGGTSLTPDQLRLIKKYTNNLTIIYDGDSAGVKAALRGLDLALEAGLNVKLILIPDNEDPDSYVNKVGPNQFNDFVQKNKKDFVLFQLEIALKDAGDDINKRSQVVNTIAQTLSKINDPKDFSKLHDYIRTCCSILKIEEGGMYNLINNIKKEKLAKDGKIYSPDETKLFYDSTASSEAESADIAIGMLLESGYQEREVIKRLIEYGTNQWDEKRKNYEIIFDAIEEYQLHDVQLSKVLKLYKIYLDEYEVELVEPKSFLLGSDVELNKFIAGLLFFPYELHDWGKVGMFEVKKLDSDIREVVDSALTYYKLRKIKLLFTEVEGNIRDHKDYQDNILNMQVHSRLKELETLIARELGAVIVK